MATFLTALFFFLLCLYMAIFAVRAHLKQKQYQRLLLAERTKSYFAKVRNEMTLLAHEDKIDANSNYFKGLYSLMTKVMRNPNSYREISTSIRSVLFDIRTYQKVTDFEPSKEEIHIAVMTNEAMGHIIVNYSWTFRFLYRFFYRKHSPAKFVRTLVKYFRYGHKHLSEKRTREREKFQLAREMQKFSSQIKHFQSA